MSHALFGPEIRGMLAQNDAAGLAALCDELHPATIAETVQDDFSVEEIWQIIGQSDIRSQAAIFEYLPLPLQEEMADTARPQVAKLIEKMSHDDRVDLLRRLPQSVSENLLRLVDAYDRRDIQTLFQYGENTVGSILTTDYAWIPANLTAAEAVDQLRQQAPDRETIYYIYVLDDAVRRSDGNLAPRRLLGTISLRDLILAPRHKMISDLMETEIVALKHTDEQQVAADLLAKYDFIAVPVLDDSGGMLGIVTYDDAIDVIRQEATEDLQRQAAVGSITGNYLEAGFMHVWYSRAFWLAVLFAAQMFTINAMSNFEDSIKQVTILALFVPLCLSVGGNAGSQATTLVIRALALEHIRIRDWFRVFRRELLMGLALASTLGVLALGRTWFLTPGDINQDLPMLLKLTWVISLSVAAICMWGTLLGAMLPLGIKKLGIDPALMSSPMIATISDVSGIMIYFSIAKQFFFNG